MSTTEKINEKFEALIKEGNEVLRKAGWDGNTYRTSHPATKDYIKFRTEALNIIKRVCGEESDHYKESLHLVPRGQPG